MEYKRCLLSCDRVGMEQRDQNHWDGYCPNVHSHGDLQSCGVFEAGWNLSRAFNQTSYHCALDPLHILHSYFLHLLTGVLEHGGDMLQWLGDVSKRLVVLMMTSVA
eukprot:347005-Pelagomonas_calceolata.AAC.5